ncbi:uncharacterized protein ccdc66 isoform X2 [Vanacampus margaritifer]
MYLGDGLLFELQNGKPKLIVLNHGAERNLVKNSLRPRPTYVLNSKQPTCAEDVCAPRPARQRLAGQHPGAPRRAKAHPTEIAASFGSSGAADGVRGSQTVSKTRERRTAAAETASKSECRKSSCPSANGTSTQSERWAGTSDVKSRAKDSLEDEEPRDAAACLSAEQVRRILRDVQTSSPDQNIAEEHAVSSQNVHHTEEEEDVRGELEEDRVGCDETTNGISPLKDNRCPGGMLGWLEQRDVDARTSVEAKKAQWRQQLNEQVALKQQRRQRCATSHGLQGDEKPASVCSVPPAFCHREQPAAIRSSLRLGAVTPMEEALAWERREEQRRLWLQDLDRQKEETSQRRKQEKMLLSQKEDHELWAAHFDSLQRKPPAVTRAPPAGPSLAPSGDWEASSSLSLAWDASSSCGAESAGRASADTSSSSSSSSRYPARSSYLRSMTALLDPVQMEERQRRRLKQLEQQRDIQAQVEERRQQRREEEARRRKGEEEEERRITLERELLHGGRQEDHHKRREERKVEQPKQQDDDDDDAGGAKDFVDERVSRPVRTVEKRDAAVQTEVAPPPAGAARLAPASSGKSRAGKENACVYAGGKGGGAYEAFARTETRKEKRRPEWNAHRPSRRFVPASERYPATQQRSRRENRLKRTEEVLGPPANPQGPRRTDTSRPPSHKEDSNRGSVCGKSLSSASRGRSPPVTQSSLQFIPYVRTDDVVHLDSAETTNEPTPHAHSAASSCAPPPNASSPADILVQPGKQRQQEILRGLAHLRQALLEKKRQLDDDMRRHGNDGLSP